MTMVILDSEEQRRLVRHRRATGLDRYDEVWDGVYVLGLLADIQHRELAARLVASIIDSLDGENAGTVYAGVNVSNRTDHWKRNYRCPDVAVYLAGNSAQERVTHYVGGPDFAAEIVIRNDRTRKKLPFYAEVGTRELLVLDRRPWSLELYRRTSARMELIQKLGLGDSDPMPIEVLPLTFSLIPGEPRPRIKLAELDGRREWLV